MVPNNIERFNTFTARIFELLYDDFPNPVGFVEDHFDLTVEIDGERVLDESAYKTVLSTVRWLDTEGYIRVADYANEMCLGVTLTQKGLTVLSTPDSLQPTETMAAKMKGALAEPAKGLLSKVVEQLFDYGTRYAMSSGI